MAQNCKKNEGEINVVDSVVKIGSDSLLSKDIDTALLHKLFYKSLELNNEYYFVYLINKTRTQYCRLSSSAVDGFWSDYVTIGKMDIKNPTLEYVSSPQTVFTSSKIRLGINENVLTKFMVKEVGCILVMRNRKILKYYWFDKSSIDYLVNNLPSDVATFIFEEKKLVNFGFGKYKAELDKDFFPSNYEIIKGEIYQ